MEQAKRSLLKSGALFMPLALTFGSCLANAQGTSSALGQPTLIQLDGSRLSGAPGSTAAIFHAQVSCDNSQASIGYGCSGTPNGIVQFLVNGVAWLTDDLDATGNVAVTVDSTWLPGRYTISAKYLGVAAYAQSQSNSVGYKISGGTPNVTLSTSNSTAPSGILVAAYVDCNQACGRVQFLVDGSDGGTVYLDGGGNASASNATWPAGNHLITALYLGDATHGQAVSAPLALDLWGPRTGTTLTLTPDGASGPPGAATTQFVAHVSCNAACGNVALQADSLEWQTLPLDTAGNVRVFNAVTWPPGNHVVSASFLGNAAFEPSFSRGVNYAVLGTPTVTTLTAGAMTGAFGSSSVPFTAHVDCNSACGSVDFQVDGKDGGTASLDSTGSFTLWSDPVWLVGEHTISASYPGDLTHNPSSSNSAAYVVSGETEYYAAPQIFNVASSTGPLGPQVTITGTNFGTSPVRVLFGRIPAVVQSWTPLSIIVTVPPGAMSGPLSFENLYGRVQTFIAVKQ